MARRPRDLREMCDGREIDATRAAPAEADRRDAGRQLLVTVEEAAKRLCVGRPKMWQLVMAGEVLSIKIGASRRVPISALEEYVERLSVEAARAASRRVRHGA